MYRFKFIRKLLGGVWYYNRHWYDMGRSCVFWWSREFYGYQGGNLCTIKEKNYE